MEDSKAIDSDMLDSVLVADESKETLQWPCIKFDSIADLESRKEVLFEQLNHGYTEKAFYLRDLKKNRLNRLKNGEMVGSPPTDPVAYLLGRSTPFAQRLVFKPEFQGLYFHCDEDCIPKQLAQAQEEAFSMFIDGACNSASAARRTVSPTNRQLGGELDPSRRCFVSIRVNEREAPWPAIGVSNIKLFMQGIRSMSQQNPAITGTGSPLTTKEELEYVYEFLEIKAKMSSSSSGNDTPRMLFLFGKTPEGVGAIQGVVDGGLVKSFAGSVDKVHAFFDLPGYCEALFAMIWSANPIPLTAQAALLPASAIGLMGHREPTTTGHLKNGTEGNDSNGNNASAPRKQDQSVSDSKRKSLPDSDAAGPSKKKRTKERKSKKEPAIPAEALSTQDLQKLYSSLKIKSIPVYEDVQPALLELGYADAPIGWINDAAEDKFREDLVKHGIKCRNEKYRPRDLEEQPKFQQLKAYVCYSRVSKLLREHEQTLPNFDCRITGHDYRRILVRTANIKWVHGTWRMRKDDSEEVSSFSEDSDFDDYVARNGIPARYEITEKLEPFDLICLELYQSDPKHVNNIFV
jgi:hypothetical protein